MTDPTTERANRALRYILEFWELHPEALARLDRVGDSDESTNDYRAWLYGEVAAATDGDLLACVPRGPQSSMWMFLVGVACGEATKAGM